jgi:hypothetical protein
MQIIEVNTPALKKDFLEVPESIYRNDPHWIRHLDNDVEAIFNPDKNKHFEHGTVTRWVLKDENGHLIGRIAAFVHQELAYSYEYPVGGMGFFECINDKKAAFLLLDTAKQWLQQQGMEAMDGPVNFGEKDRFWGLLTHKINQSTPYLLNYNPPYYQALLEDYGFQNYYEQYVFSLRTDIDIHPMVHRNFARLTQNQGYTFEKPDLKRLEKFAEDFRTIYNEAWQDVHKSFKPMTREQALATFRGMKDVVDEDLIVFVYHNERPVATFIGIPELNQIFRHLNGKLNLMGKLKFLYHKWKGTCTTIYGIVFGIVPEYRNKGVESGLILALQKQVKRKNRYTDMYIAWIGDFNPKMIRIVELLTNEKAFTLVTYRKLFSDKYKFSRHPVID